MDPREKRRISLLLGIIAVLTAANLIVLGLKSREAKEAESEGAQQEIQGVITQQHAYSALTYSNGSSTLSFALDEAGKWIWADDPDFPLDDAVVASMVELLTTLKPQQTITEGDTLESYGLDRPSMTLTASGEDGGVLALSFGKTTTDGNSYYMLMNGAESPVYIIAGTLAEKMRTPIYDMCLLPEFPDLPEARLDAVSLQGAETKTSITASRPEAEEDGEDPASAAATWTSGGQDVTDSQTLAELLRTLDALSFEKCVDFKPSQEAASICGFDAPTAVLRVQYRTEAGVAAELTLTLGTQAYENDGRYARMNDDDTVYLLSADLAEVLLGVAENGL